MKTRRHHNNKGQRQVKTGRTVDQVKRMARRLGIPFGTRVVLSPQDHDAFVRQINNPSPPSKALVDLMRSKPVWEA